MAPIVYATARPLRPLTNYPSPAAEEGGARGPGAARGRRKSIAGSEYIQRRSAVRVWKFETAFLARVLSETPGGIRTRRQFAPGAEEEARGGDGEEEEKCGMRRGGRAWTRRWTALGDDLATRVSVTSVLRGCGYPAVLRDTLPCPVVTVQLHIESKFPFLLLLLLCLFVPASPEKVSLSRFKNADGNGDRRQSFRGD